MNISLILAIVSTNIFIVVTVYRIVTQRNVILAKRAELEIFSIVGILGSITIGLWIFHFVYQQLFFPMLPSLAFSFIGACIGMLILAVIVRNERLRRRERFDEVFPSLDGEGTIYVATVNGRGRAHFLVDEEQKSFDVYTSSEEYEIGEKVEIVNISNGIITVIKKSS